MSTAPQVIQVRHELHALEDYLDRLHQQTRQVEDVRHDLRQRLAMLNREYHAAPAEKPI